MKLKGGANVWQTLYRGIQDSSRKTTYRRWSFRRRFWPEYAEAATPGILNYGEQIIRYVASAYSGPC